MAYPYDQGQDYYQDPSQIPKPQTPGNTGYTGAGGLPPGYSQAEVDDFLRRNPGDTARIFTALNDRGPQSQHATPSQQWNNTSQQSSAFYDQLMKRANQSLNVDRNDPTLRAQVDPAVAQQERSSRTYLNQLAERSGSLSNLQGERRLASERGGQAAGQLESQVIGREVDARRQEISQALSMYGAMLSADQRNALERELGYLNADIAKRGQDVTSRGQDLGYDEFLRQLALNQWQAQDNSAFQWAGLGG